MSNLIVDSPIVYSLMERRLLYYLTLEVKRRYTEKTLGVPGSWQELYFHMTDSDLGFIGGKTHVLQTYEALSEIGKKFVLVSFKSESGQLVVGKVHWVDTFHYNTETGMYAVRVSPEIMPYLINLSKSFTTFDVSTAMMLSSKFSQKFYELCCQFAGDFRFTDINGNRYLKPDETGYYLRMVGGQKGNKHDSYLQAIQVILDKERQPKFANATRAYKRKSIMQYTLQENLKEYGWSIQPLQPRMRMRTESCLPGFMGGGL